ncbi:Uncharacterized protein TPAR_07296 [Tolypocladium paradoxum]|uniref:CPAF-like PDZ domain-containing protein n=1 Tax=Tolypocladium paradoxum TaxID=94208 RepID=A0A2S4KQQ7_9HYPO|nr:Uncharacterized protein TPAR_07296 [Tolypocladium paradoxum]
MRRDIITVAALLAGGADSVAARCAANNCLRAMRATQIPGRLESARAFCSTFTSATVAATAIPTFAVDACKPNQNGDMTFRLSSACSCIAPTTTVPTTTATGTTTVPTATASVAACARASSSWAEQIKTTGTCPCFPTASPRIADKSPATPTVAAALAYECLNSVPLNKDAAIEFVDSIEPYLEWQSDAAYKADPPEDYFYPGFDMFANLAKVKSNLQADKYANEYAFQSDLYKTVFGPGHDGHFVLYPDALSRAFKWKRQRSLVSISEDGTSLPVIKLYDMTPIDLLPEDVVSSPSTASAVKLINGIDAAKYVQDTINTATFNQDVDSAYNTMFYEASMRAAAGVSGYFAGGGRISIIYQGPNTTFTFQNGTVLSLENKAAVVGNMTGVVDGASFYSAFCVPKKATPASPVTPAVSQNGVIPGYPQPVIATKDGIVSGYYLTGGGLEDVAVIVLLAFESESAAEFQAVCQDFFAEAVAAGKTKLVIDLQANGGGFILQGYDFFRQLFPRVQEDGFSRWKGNNAFTAISQVVSDEVADLDPFTSSDADKINDYETWFNYRYDLNLTNDKFLTFEDKFAPHVFKDTPYTAIMRWNLTDPLTTTNSTFGMGMEISGYGKLANISQPFAAENIVMLYDGVCASTCTLASEMLRIQGGVKSIAFGGRPIEGPIQGVGGVKGSQVLSFTNIFSYTQRAASLTKDPKKLAEFARYSNLPLQRSTSAAVNVRDQILRDNVNDGLPAQFVAENSDCRLYWQAPMINDVSEVWKAAAHAAFNGAKCAHGGIASSTQKRVSSVAANNRHAMPRQRTSELIDRAVRPPIHSEHWLAMHLQKAIP